MKAMAKNPDDRYGSAEELRATCCASPMGAQSRRRTRA